MCSENNLAFLPAIYASKDTCPPSICLADIMKKKAFSLTYIDVPNFHGILSGI